MAYLVIAVGLLTSLAGGYLLNYGYAIVQVERGWSSVIAGSVFVSGGLVTMGLGLVLRAVTDVRRGLFADVQRGLVERPLAASSVAGAEAGIAYPELSGATIGAIAVPSAVAAAEPSFASRDVDLYALSIADEVLPREISPREPALDQPHDSMRGDAEPADHDGQHRDGLRHDDEAAIDAGGSDPTRPIVTTRDAAAAPAMDDWLDRAFSDMDGADRDGATRPRTSAESAVTQVADAYGTDDLGLQPSRYEARLSPVEPTHVELVDAQPVQADPEPAATAEPVRPRPPAPAPTPHDSPVIGRYESDETSYIMYADGSIEAQSPAGIYRFSSMAELKAFIEG